MKRIVVCDVVLADWTDDYRTTTVGLWVNISAQEVFVEMASRKILLLHALLAGKFSVGKDMKEIDCFLMAL